MPLLNNDDSKNPIANGKHIQTKSATLGHVIHLHLTPCGVYRGVFAHYGDLIWTSQWQFFMYSLGTRK